MTDLITRYRQLLDEIAEKFALLMEKQGYWMSDYSLWCTEWEAWSPEDMLYILEKYGHLKGEPLEALRDDVEAWLEYNVDVAQFHIQYINLKSWLMGAPRMSKEHIDRLHALRNELDTLCKQHQAEFGKLNTSSQPEHLQTLKPR